MNHYVYILEHQETKEFYIGSRSCKCDPKKDKYMGSMYSWKPNKKLLTKSIIKSDFNSRQEALDYEIKLIQKYIEDDLNRNYHIPSVGFQTQGQVTVRDKDGNTFNVSVDDPRYLSGELKNICLNKVTVKDSNNNCFIVDKTDPRYLSGELIHVCTNRVNVKCSNGNIFNVSVDDPRYLSGELVHVCTNRINVKCSNGNIFNVSVDDPRYLSGELIPIWKDRKSTRLNSSHSQQSRMPSSA